MNKFFEWFENCRKPIGITIGCMNLFLSASYFSSNLLLSLMWASIGTVILLDALEL